MRSIIAISILLVLFPRCSKDSYNYDGTNYKWFSLDEALKFKEKVVALDLSYQNLTKIPEEVSQLKNLKFLNLKGNNLRELPDFIYKNEKLTTLLLYQNINFQFSSSIVNLEGLEILDIIQCKMTALPSEIYTLQKLKGLAIGGNNFSKEQVQMLRLKLPSCRIIESVD